VPNFIQNKRRVAKKQLQTLKIITKIAVSKR